MSRHCEAVHIGEDIFMSCTKSLWPVEYLCEIEMVDASHGFVDCIGTELLEVEANCDVQMDDAYRGDIIC